MGTLFRVLAVLCVAIGAFLIYAVIAALTSDEGARAGVAIGYVIGAVILFVGASYLWKNAGTRTRAAV